MCSGSASSGVEGRIAALERCKSASADEQLSACHSVIWQRRSIDTASHQRANSQDTDCLSARLSMLADKMPALHTSSHTRPAAAAIFHGSYALCPALLPCDLFTAYASPSMFPLVCSFSTTPLPPMLSTDDVMAGSELGLHLQYVTTDDADND
ncbi:hypothetical protein K488DRAFT_89889 [Vararia minispora EC-137]|uniref:Uncharacterized protein n=1 Tax=Vararia minispora EC-137 TaxID=1314806 RepID=A0ACB8Q985_9AGAM|nr:hypothetical protein K488DRAFT_89889 [Vararia minispora EC-137]